MKICTTPYCPQPSNIDTANFCIGCGSPLPQVVIAQKNNTLLYIIIGLLSLALLGVAGYFIFSGDKSAASASVPTNSQPPVAIAPGGTAGESTMPQPAAEVAPPPSSTKAHIVKEVKPKQTSTPESSVQAEAVASAPKQQLQNTGNTELSADELAAVSTQMKNYFVADNNGNIDALLNTFAYPVARYYDLKGATYEQLQGRLSHFMDDKLSYHNLTPDYSTSTVAKNGNGYAINIKGFYEWTMKSTGKQGSKAVNLKFQLDNSYNITSIYE